MRNMRSKRTTLIISLVGLYLISAGISLAAFTFLRGNPSISFISGNIDEARSKIGANLPKTEECPINGEMFTSIEEGIWSKRRPITGVVENHLDSRPQSGLSRADVVYEYVAEGGITRFLGIFYCNAAASDVRIGPIRSIRQVAINLAGEYGPFPLLVHSGGANNICKTCPGGVKPRGTVDPRVNAFDILSELGWRSATGNALDAGTNVGYPEVWRDYERIPGVASEHTYMGSTDKLFDVGIERGFAYEDESGDAWDKNFTMWKFVDGEATSSPKAAKIAFEFWSNKTDYDVVWDYNKDTNEYLRTNGGKPHTDLDNKKQISAENVVIQFVKEEGPVDKEHHMYYEVVDEGDALIFQNGNVIEGKWEKDSLSSKTKFTDNSGKEVSFVRGQTWIELVPAGNKINY